MGSATKLNRIILKPTKHMSAERGLAQVSIESSLGAKNITQSPKFFNHEKLWTHSADAKADLNICGANMLFVVFCLALAQMVSP